MRPGSTDPRRANLGFHLARCPECKAYSERANNASLLLALLDTTPPEEPQAEPVAALLIAAPPEPAPALPELPPAASHQPAARPGPPRPLRRRGSRPVWRYALYGALALVVFLLVAIGGPLAMAGLTITRNLQAMQITAAPSVASTPVIVVPTAPPQPTSSPRPAAGVLDAPLDGPTVPPDLGVPSDVAATASPRPTVAAQVSVTPVRLPPVGGPVMPTLMPTFGVLPSVASGEAVNILLLGSDRRPGESWQTRSDAIVVVRLDPAAQRVAMLSLPRDLIVSIPGYGQGRINAATVYGEMDSMVGGVELARQTVGQLLGVPIDHVVRADFNAFTTAIDAIGGIDLYVEQELYDPQYPTMDYGYQEVFFPAGPMHMDGETALIYSRVRHMDSNYARNRRQQQVLLAIMQRVREQNVLGQVQMMADLSTALRDDIQTDLSLDQMISMAWAFRGLSPDQVERYALDETMVYEGGILGDPYATLPAPGAIATLVGQLMGAER